MKFGYSRRSVINAAVAILILSTTGQAYAEINHIVVAREWGISYLVGIVLQQDKLIEKHLTKEGLKGVRVTYTQFGGGSAMTDALLSGNLQLGIIGWGPLLTLWAKTHTTDNTVKAIWATSASPMILTTNNPNVKSVKDFTAADRIAVPSVKVSTNAIMLEMAAAKAFGFKDYAKLDPLTVSMKHPDAAVALISKSGAITADVTVQPYAYEELQHSYIHKVFDSSDVFGGHPTLNLAVTTTKFQRENPKTYLACAAAVKEAVKIINVDKRRAAAMYKKVTGEKRYSVNDIYEMIKEPYQFSITPDGLMAYAEFLYKVGRISAKPASWKDLFFSNAHGLAGS